MRAVLLVGGQGTRMRPLTYKTPKSLLPIGNVPFLARQLDWLASFGVTHTTLSLGYLPDAFSELIPQGEFQGMKINYAVEPEPLGTAGAIRFAANGATESTVVCNGDVLTDLDLSEMISAHRARGAKASISLTWVDDPSSFGVVPCDPDGRVTEFAEKPPANSAPSHWINAGTYILEPEVIAAIPLGETISIERTTFPSLIEQGVALFGFEHHGYWLDIGTPEKFMEANQDILARRIAVSVAPGAREVSPSVWVQGSASIDNGAEIQGPALVGDGAVVESGARIQSSAVGPKCRIDAGAVVEGSVLLPGVTVACDSLVSQSVIGYDVRVPEKCRVTSGSVVGSGVELVPGEFVDNERRGEE